MSASESKDLRAIYRRRGNSTDFVPPLVARALTEASRETGRRLGVLIDRKGEVEKVIVGDAHKVFLPDLGPRRGGADRFRGVRLLLAGPGLHRLTEDDLTDLTLLRLDAVIVLQVLPDGLPGEVQYATLEPPDAETPWRIAHRATVHHWDEPFDKFIAALEARFGRNPRLKRVEGQPGALLIGIDLGDRDRAVRGLAELERLAQTAGLRVLDTTLSRRKQLDGKTCIGQGKLEEVLLRSMHLGVEVLVFDRELSPSQMRNVATATDLKVLDRTQLILDIFAQHASTREGRLQVELAQLRYRAPRLAIMPTAMSRLTGGIGGRGPGETKLEINRRRAQERLTRLERELEELAKNRAVRRARRQRTGIPIVSIVGYTNAGKSTLLNRLTESEVLSEDKLFATLDPTSRRLRFPEAREILITDTVGFIEDLPQTLIAAFRATLEELEEADLLLEVVDAGDPNAAEHLEAVATVLRDLDLTGTRLLRVWNKADRLAPEDRERRLAQGEVLVSALDGSGCDDLLRRLEGELFQARQANAPLPSLERT